MSECLFCKIVNKEMNAEIVYEDDLVIAFPDIHPMAPVHVLIIPKEHIESANQLTDDEKGEKIGGRLLLAAKKIAADKRIAENGYKLLIRTGSYGGQEVPHLHMHLIGGAKLTEEIRPIS